MVLGGLLLLDSIEVNPSLMMKEIEVSARLYNPLDIALTILDIYLPLKKVNRNTQHAIVSMESVGIPGHLTRPEGTTLHSPNHISLPPHARAVPVSVTFGVNQISQFTDPVNTEVNIDGGVIRVAFGDYPTNRVDLSLMLNIEDVSGVRCHGINAAAANGSPMAASPAPAPPPFEPVRPATPPPLPNSIQCNASTPVVHGSACSAGTYMDTCTIQCMDEYGTHAGMSATYMCYTGEWIPMLGPMFCN